MNGLKTYLTGGDLRSIAKADQVVPLIKNQTDFDKLFQFLFTKDRLVIMRTADAIEKITLNKPEFLSNHKKDIINFLEIAVEKEFKWHLALIVSRLDLTIDELRKVWNKLSNWAKDKKESKIVRVNSIQALFDLERDHKELEKDLELTIKEVKAENIPSINARLRKFKKGLNE